jgi:hypothetical protein
MDPIVNELALLRRALLGARGKQALSTPLFLVVGLRGAGKSTLLTHCGLRYGHQSRSDGRVTTRASDDAAFVEYDVSEDPRAAKRELDVLTGELAKCTSARPLAGVLVVVPLGQLGSDTHYNALRPVLDAVATRCGARVPIHVVVTQLDLVGGHAEFHAAMHRNPSVLGVRLPLTKATDHNRWNEPIAKLLDSVLETSVALMTGSPKSSPLRFGLGMPALAQPLAEWLRRLETPSRGAEPLLPRSVFLMSTRDPTSTSLAMQAIVEDAALSRVTSRRLTQSALRWTLPTGLPIVVGAAALSTFLMLPQAPPPEPTAPEPQAEMPATPPKPKKGFVLDTRPPGPKFPPEVCAAANAASGEWSFQTMVTATNPGQESGIGIRGIYTLVLDATDCDLSLTVTKTGYVSPGGAPKSYAKSQIGEDPLDEASVEGTDATRILWLPVVLDMNNTDGTDPLKQEFVIGFRVEGGVAKRITGEWRQAGSARSSTGYWGYIEGERESIAPAGPGAQACRVQCRLACGWSEQARVDRCRESCAADLFGAVASCPS